MTKIIENKVPLSLREKADNKVLFRLFNPKRDKITIGGKSRDIQSLLSFMKSLDLVQLLNKPLITLIEKWISSTIQQLTVDLKKLIC